MLKWEKIQTKTEAEFAFSYVLKALDGAKIERLFTSEMIGGPRLDENEAVYTLLEGKLYIQFDNQMCLILYYNQSNIIITSSDMGKPTTAMVLWWACFRFRL